MISYLQRERDDETGVTILELLIVMTTIAALLVITVPGFLGARSKALDRTAQADLRTAYQEAQISYFDQYSFDTANAAGLALMDPSIPFDNGGATIAPTETKIFVSASGPTWVGVKYSKSGSYFGLTATAGGAIRRCKTVDLNTAQAWTAASCNGTW